MEIKPNAQIIKLRRIYDRFLLEFVNFTPSGELKMDEQWMGTAQAHLLYLELDKYFSENKNVKK